MVGTAHGHPEGIPRQRAARQAKSATAFRTISEVAGELDVAQHVLRFWESKFPQVRPLKRGGGRRYYRPEDVEVLRQIRALLYEEGYTIKGAQKLLKTKKTSGAGSDSTEPQASTEAATGGTLETAEASSPGGGHRSQLERLRAELVALRDALLNAAD